MKHMVIMGLMLAFALPAIPADHTAAAAAEARLARMRDRVEAVMAEARERIEAERERREREQQERRARDAEAAEAAAAEAAAAEAAAAEARDAKYGLPPGTTARGWQGQSWEEARDAELGLAPGTTAREWQESLARAEAERERREREQQERIEAEQQERQAREDAERERQERTDALPTQARLAAELCHEADAVMAMVVDVARYDTSKHANERTIIEDRRYYPAAPAEVALKLSQLARDLRKEAALWGSPCDP